MPVGNCAEDEYNHASWVNWGEAVDDDTRHTQAQTDTSIAITLTLLLAPPVRGEKRKREKEKETDVWTRRMKLLEDCTWRDRVYTHSHTHTHASTSLNQANRMFPDRTKGTERCSTNPLTWICFSCAVLCEPQKAHCSKLKLPTTTRKQNSNKAFWSTAHSLQSTSWNIWDELV